MKYSKIIIGSDHAGYDMKESVKKYIEAKGIEVVDKGPFSSESVDYPDYAHSVSSAVNNKEFALGILLCGSGNGVCMTANKYENVRAALSWNAEIAKLSRQHNDANILCMPARFVSEEKAKSMVEEFLNTDFEGGRHENRKNKIAICKK